MLKLKQQLEQLLSRSTCGEVFKHQSTHSRHQGQCGKGYGVFEGDVFTGEVPDPIDDELANKPIDVEMSDGDEMMPEFLIMNSDDEDGTFTFTAVVGDGVSNYEADALADTVEMMDNFDDEEQVVPGICFLYVSPL